MKMKTFIYKCPLKSLEVIIMAKPGPVKCPYCGRESVKKGFRKTKNLGLRQVRFCTNCSRKFTPKKQRPADTDIE